MQKHILSQERLLLLRYVLWLPIYVFSFFLLERIHPSASYWSSDLPLDNLIPFCPAFLVFYDLWYVLLAGMGCYLLCRDASAFRRYMRFLAVTFFVSALIWLLFPSEQNLRPVSMQDGVFSPAVAFLYQIDTNTNVFPSVHVVGAAGTALAAGSCQSLRAHTVLRRGIYLLSVLICLSTMLIKQHALLDVIGGLLLSMAAAVWIYPKERSLQVQRVHAKLRQSDSSV